VDNFSCFVEERLCRGSLNSGASQALETLLLELTVNQAIPHQALPSGVVCNTGWKVVSHRHAETEKKQMERRLREGIA
jgi:hypothetical protein